MGALAPCDTCGGRGLADRGARLVQAVPPVSPELAKALGATPTVAEWAQAEAEQLAAEDLGLGPPRGTGRTTRQLQAALMAAADGARVAYVASHNPTHAFDMAVDIVTESALPWNRHDSGACKITFAGGGEIRFIPLQRARARLDGWAGRVFVDHHAAALLVRDAIGHAPEGI